MPRSATEKSGVCGQMNPGKGPAGGRCTTRLSHVRSANAARARAAAAAEPSSVYTTGERFDAPMEPWRTGQCGIGRRLMFSRIRTGTSCRPTLSTPSWPPWAHLQRTYACRTFSTGISSNRARSLASVAVGQACSRRSPQRSLEYANSCRSPYRLCACSIADTEIAQGESEAHHTVASDYFLRRARARRSHIGRSAVRSLSPASGHVCRRGARRTASAVHATS